MSPAPLFLGCSLTAVLYLSGGEVRLEAMDKPPKSKHPLATVHPRALRACVLCSRLRLWCVWGMLIGVVLIVPIFIVYIIMIFAFHLNSSSDVPAGLAVAALICSFGSLFGIMVITLVRMAIVVLFFTRYSLAHLLGVVLFIGACGTGMVKLSGVWMLFPIAGLCTLLVLILTYVGDQDPEGRSHTPAFLRKALERQESAKKESSKPQINADEHR